MATPIERIRSRSHELIQAVRETSSGKNKEYFLLEGVRILEEANRVRFPLEALFFEPGLKTKPRAGELINDLQNKAQRVCAVDESLLHSIGEVENSQGILALAKRPRYELSTLLEKEKAPFLLIAAGLSDPGNLGSLIRSADAAGAGAVLVTEQSVSPFNSKCVRATMGSVLRLPVLESQPWPAIEEFLKQKSVRIVATDSHEGIDFRDADYSGPIALCLGAEAEGIPKEIRKATSLTVRIRLHHDVESLNVAAAGAILLFEIAGARR